MKNVHGPPHPGRRKVHQIAFRMSTDPDFKNNVMKILKGDRWPMAKLALVKAEIVEASARFVDDELKSRGKTRR